MEKNLDFYNSDGRMEFDLNCIREIDCIMVDKVYAQCQDRECFSSIEAQISDTFETIRFRPGFIVPGTLVVSDLPDRPHFRRVRFTLRIPYEIIMQDGTIKEENLPDIQEDIVMFIPDARDEFQFNIVVETSSQILGQPIITGENITFAVGIFIIIKVVGKVQLLIPTFGFCPEPPPCIEFAAENICDGFDVHPFPVFFPLQYEDIFADD
ncbi:hypothetical protein KQI42_19585 [Tissierella sp. MSJ-40]|uniref:SipL SPOCS domain-containing protein n=1 Tax=Tissierella simiarum TaxID=2841534 RepID=A0ABS6ECM1_9FIRM|nr:hypothetical protein [Tissierella simiarum]MBU5440200.1 hypothetical protein [Tissierella simiarum]